MSSSEWRALGTYVFLATDPPQVLPAAVALARRVLDAVDRACSRFRDDSDLVRANARPGEWVAVDPLLVEATRVALEAAAATDGLVDPCLGRPLAALGYDADLAVVRARDPGTFRPSFLSGRNPDAWRDVRTDEWAVRVPPGCALDLGATGKAWAADLVAAAVTDELHCRTVVSLGGDVRVDGPARRRDPDPWPVQVTERPAGTVAEQVPPVTVWLADGGLATSSVLVRRWSSAGGELHHLVDPRSGRPTTGSWRTVTATGATCAGANTASTAALVLGPDAEPWLREHRVGARLVGTDGDITCVGDWPGSETRSPSPLSRGRSS